MAHSHKLLIGCFLLIAILCLVEQISEAQETPPQMSDQARRYHRLVSQSQWVYEITFDGLMHTNLVHRRLYRTPLPLLEILTHPEIAKDLELVEFQQQQLKNQIEALEEACRQAKQEDELPLIDADQRERKLLQILEPPIEKSIQTIRELLLANQTERLKQILLHLEINRRGLLSFLESQFGSEIGLTREQKSRLRKHYLELAQEWLKQVNSQKKESVDTLLGAATESTRETLKNSVGHENNLYRIPLKVLALQLDEQAISGFTRFQVESRWPRYAGITVPFSFEMNSLAEFSRVEPVNSPDSYDAQIPQVLIIYCLIGGELELVPEQRRAIADLRRQQRQHWQSQTQAVNDYVEANQTHFVPDSLRKQLADEDAKFRGKMVQIIESILLPHQQEVLTEFAARTKFSLHGPVAAIVNTDSAGKKPQKKSTLATSGKTTPQKSTPSNATPSIWSRIENQGLKTLANREQEKINKLLIKIERDSNRALLKELSAEQKKKLDLLLGTRLNLEQGNIEFHLALTQKPADVGIRNESIWMEDIQIDPDRMKPDDVTTSSGH
jgi:hypothetical protein